MTTKSLCHPERSEGSRSVARQPATPRFFGLRPQNDNGKPQNDNGKPQDDNGKPLPPRSQRSIFTAQIFPPLVNQNPLSTKIFCHPERSEASSPRTLPLVVNQNPLSF
jgi:hypothetical protein